MGEKVTLANQRIGIAIKTARISAGLDQGQLSHLIGVERMTVSRWERGASTVPESRRQRLAEALGVTEGAIWGLRGVSHETPRMVVPESESGYSAGPKWPSGVRAIAAKLELQILEAGGGEDAAKWARRALVSPEQYVRFYPSGAPNPRPDADVLAQLEFIAEMLFTAAVGKRPGGKGRGRSGPADG